MGQAYEYRYSNVAWWLVPAIRNGLVATLDERRCLHLVALLPDDFTVPSYKAVSVPRDLATSGSFMSTAP